MSANNLLAKEFREKMKKIKDVRMSSEGGYDIGYPTGFFNIDFRNATSFNGIKDGKVHTNYILGLIDGSMNTIIGRSGCGKSTLALQLAGNIASTFENSIVYHDDIEGGSSYSRRQFLLGFNDEEMEYKYFYRNSGITIENLYQRVKAIYDSKMAHYDELLYETELYDSKGERIKKLVPTIYIVDSIAVLMPEKYAEEEEISGQMSTTATAKGNKALATRLLQLLKPANIIMIFINHINEDVSITGMPKKPTLPFLKVGEALPGGRGIHYLQNNIIRIDDGTKLKDTDKFMIDGNISVVSFVKSRTNKSGKGVPLIFNQEMGYDNDLSILQLLIENKRVNGAGAFLYINDRSDKKFSNKKFKEMLYEDEEFYNIVYSEAINILKEMISYGYEMEGNASTVKNNMREKSRNVLAMLT